MHDFDKHLYGLSQLRDLLTEKAFAQLLDALSIEDKSITNDQLRETIITRAETERRRRQNVENLYFQTDGVEE